MPLSLDVGSAFSGVGKIIDELKVDETERAEAKAKLLGIEAATSEAVLEYESNLANAQRDVIVAEAGSQSWLARNWRPVLMLTATSILAHQYLFYPYLSRLFEMPEIVLPERLWVLLTVGVGGYIAGRSGEKIVQSLRGTEVVNAMMDPTARQERKAEGRRVKSMKKLAKLAKKHGWSDEELQDRLDGLDA